MSVVDGMDKRGSVDVYLPNQTEREQCCVAEATIGVQTRLAEGVIVNQIQDVLNDSVYV